MKLWFIKICNINASNIVIWYSIDLIFENNDYLTTVNWKATNQSLFTTLVAPQPSSEDGWEAIYIKRKLPSKPGW